MEGRTFFLPTGAVGKCDGVMSCLSLFTPLRPRIGLSQRYGGSCSLGHQTPGVEAARDGGMDPSSRVAPLPTRPLCCWRLEPSTEPGRQHPS